METPLTRKLFVSLYDLQCTTAFVQSSGFPFVWSTRRRDSRQIHRRNYLCKLLPGGGISGRHVDHQTHPSFVTRQRLHVARIQQGRQLVQWRYRGRWHWLVSVAQVHGQASHWNITLKSLLLLLFGGGGGELLGLSFFVSSSFFSFFWGGWGRGWGKGVLQNQK